jgi:hypothetical protein
VLGEVTSEISTLGLFLRDLGASNSMPPSAVGALSEAFLFAEVAFFLAEVDLGLPGLRGVFAVSRVAPLETLLPVLLGYWLLVACENLGSRTAGLILAKSKEGGR